MSITMFYDSHCPLCHTEAVNMQRRRPQDIRIVPVDEAVAELAAAGISRTQAMTYLCIYDAGKQRWHTHMDAVRLLYQTAGLTLLHHVLCLPLIKQAGNVLYPVFARHRYRIPKWLIRRLYGRVCDDGMCSIPPAKR